MSKMGVSNGLSWHFLFISVFYPAHSLSHPREWILADATGNSLRGCPSSLTPISPYPFLWLGFHLDCNIHPCPSGFLLGFANGWLRRKKNKINKKKSEYLFPPFLSILHTVVCNGYDVNTASASGPHFHSYSPHWVPASIGATIPLTLHVPELGWLCSLDFPVLACIPILLWFEWECPS